MGQKINPNALRFGTTYKKSTANWFASKRLYAKYLQQDLLIRDYVANTKSLSDAEIAKVEINRAHGASEVEITLHAARPGKLIGTKGQNVQTHKNRIKAILMPYLDVNIIINIKEVKQAATDAVIVASRIAQEIERRKSYKRVIKKQLQAIMRNQNVLGVKIQVNGRLNGAEIARSETMKEGSIPLHTLRANIDYAEARALTTFGIIGIKVWVHKKSEDTVKDDASSEINRSRGN
jgi:small subunit ribosomal protein S3